jgi:CarD family transcriptional regulator
MTFNVGDYAVYPGHGVAQVRAIDCKHIGNEEKYFYILKLISNGMTVMVPTDSKGIRKLARAEEIDDIFSILQNRNVTPDSSTWNRRYRDYMAKIKTGSLIEIAEVLRALFLLKIKKNLSFGEKKMLDQCKELLGQEISITQGSPKQKVFEKIDALFNDN